MCKISPAMATHTEGDDVIERVCVGLVVIRGVDELADRHDVVDIWIPANLVFG